MVPCKMLVLVQFMGADLVALIDHSLTGRLYQLHVVRQQASQET